MDFRAHLNKIINKANASLGFVKRWSRDFTDPYVLKVLFCAFVRPILEYACVVWSPYFQVHVSRVESVQKRFLRFALRRLPWNDRVVLPSYFNRLKLINMDSLAQRREAYGILFIGRLLFGEIDSSYLLGVININCRPRVTRNRLFIYLNFHRSLYAKCSPMSTMSQVFNQFFVDFDIDFNASNLSLKKILVNYS